MGPMIDEDEGEEQAPPPAKDPATNYIHLQLQLEDNALTWAHLATNEYEDFFVVKRISEEAKASDLIAKTSDEAARPLLALPWCAERGARRQPHGTRLLPTRVLSQ